MTRGEIWKDFFKRTVLPAVIALFLFFMFKNVFTEDGQTNCFYVWLCCGIPFGIRRMFVWLVPHGYDIAGTVGIIALNFILGGIIGGVILIWRLVVAAWYIPLTIYRLYRMDFLKLMVFSTLILYPPRCKSFPHSIKTVPFGSVTT